MRSSSRILLNSLDPDARLFCDENRVTDPVARRQLSDFARGIKQIVPWSQFVCWPMRSAQQGRNAGTTTVASFGGLGDNATLVNGPTWSADYISLGTSQTFTAEAISIAAYSAVVVSEAVSSNQSYLLQNTADDTVVQLRRAAGIGWQLNCRDANSNAPPIGWTPETSVNGGVWASARNVAATWPSVIICRSGGSNLDMSPSVMTTAMTSATARVAFQAALSLSLTDHQAEAVRLMYKQTLGVGLTLP